MNISVVLPCLNEEKTLIKTILNAVKGCEDNVYEIIIADNGSTDSSIIIAKIFQQYCPIRIINVKRKGYGSALLSGIKVAKYENIVIADADATYELENLQKFIKPLCKYDIVIGDRFCDENIQMKASHIIGNKILSFIARKLYHSNIRDFHCGIRAFKKEKILSLNLHKSGMEFASEMICVAEKKNLKIKQVPTVLRKNIRPVKLNAIRDGLRHLKFLISYC